MTAGGLSRAGFSVHLCVTTEEKAEFCARRCSVTRILRARAASGERVFPWKYARVGDASG